MALVLRYAARSDIGLVRAGNEDSGYAGPRLIAVADGMGGHAAGELASATTVATLAELDTADVTTSEILDRLSDAVHESSSRLVDLVVDDPELAGMGTTLTALTLLEGRVAIVHIGDSRAYLRRNGFLTQLTVDHTYVQALVEAGRITPEEAAIHPRRNVLVRALDGRSEPDPDLSVREAHEGDRLLVCSDGLSGVVTDEVLRQLLALEDPTAAVTALVDAALEAGAPDNVTCVVADIVDLPEAPTTGIAVVVGAAGERRVRDRLSSLSFPIDAQPDPAGVDITAGPPTAEVPITRAPAPKRRRNWTPLLLAVIAIAALVVGLTLARTWIQNQWYVGNSGGVVTIYQGIPYSIGPFNLSSVERSSTTAVASLPDIYRSSVEATIGVPDLAAAEQKVADLEAQSQACAKSPSTNGCPPIAPVQS